MTSPKQTWKRLHQLTTGTVDWNNYVEAVLHYMQEPGEQNVKPKRRRRRRSKKRRNLDKQPQP